MSERILRFQLENTDVGQDNFYATLTVEDLTKIIKDTFGISYNFKIKEVFLLGEGITDIASRKV